MKRQLFEYYTFDRAHALLEESVGPKGKELYMSGIMVQADVRNHNQRVYPVSEISHAITEMKKRISEGYPVLGELDHPETLTINLDRASHVITDVWMDGKNGMGKLKIIRETPCGQIAHALLEAGVKLGVSSRGSGNVGYNGDVSDFELVTVDIVAQPSAPEAYPKAIYESLFNMSGGSMIMEVARAATQDVRAEKYLAKDIVKFIKDLKL